LATRSAPKLDDDKQRRDAGIRRKGRRDISAVSPHLGVSAFIKNFVVAILAPG